MVLSSHKVFHLVDMYIIFVLKILGKHNIKFMEVIFFNISHTKCLVDIRANAVKRLRRFRVYGRSNHGLIVSLWLKVE